uniref:Doublecortin domain-containing protein n=1 Tax=Angiostrongylus cantonensis TaxID=6313 RepID=A0A0K0DH20_ANGCA
LQVIFLDALTRKLGTTTAVHKLYSIHGNKVHHFAELENNGEYVAVERGPFIDCNYGAHRVWTQVEKVIRVTESKPIFLNSGDSMDIYLKKEGYGSTTCLPYPLDGLSKSPTLSNFYLGGLSTQKVRILSELMLLDRLVAPVENITERTQTNRNKG